MILLHCLFLNSLPTTPFNRDPIGSPPLLINTQALSSKRTTLPSGRCSFFAVRTTTAVAVVAAADFVGGGDGDGAAAGGLGAEVALFLDYDDDAVALWEGRGVSWDHGLWCEG